MDDGKPTGQKPKWWSRPARPTTHPAPAPAPPGRSTPTEPPTTEGASGVTPETAVTEAATPETGEASEAAPFGSSGAHAVPPGASEAPGDAMPSAAESGAALPAATTPSPAETAPADAVSVRGAGAVETGPAEAESADTGGVLPTPAGEAGHAPGDATRAAVGGNVPADATPSAAGTVPTDAAGLTPAPHTQTGPAFPADATPSTAGDTVPADATPVAAGLHAEAQHADATPATAAPHADATTAAAPVADAGAPHPVPPRVTPLHEPDPYSTPPYGGPGPWAPAPPVQRPVGTPAHGTPVPPPAYGIPQPHPAPHQPQAHPHPHPQPMPAAAAPLLPLQYDPWSAPGQHPLTHSGAPAPKEARRGVGLVAALVLVAVSGVLGGGVGAYVERNGGITTVELPQAGPEDTGRAPDSVAGIAASALPSVVTIHVSGGGSQGTGTGFVLDPQGHILTNNHVVEPAGTTGSISVTFSGGETARAKLVGKDSGYDLAVVQVTGVSNLKPLPLGNSDNVRVGDPVVAIGAPFDLQNTVTSGIISAKERPITAGGEKGDGSDISYVDALQTDAPINPGNSGGPLLDSKARVIGINSAIRAAGSASGPEGGGTQSGSIGLGFAIPVNQAKRVAEELINTGKATHPVIGVSLDMKYTGDGAKVGDKGKDDSPSITAGGPAERAGIKPGDIITKVDGQRVHGGEELIVKIRSHRPGDRLELTVLRGGKELTKTLTLGSSQGT